MRAPHVLDASVAGVTKDRDNFVKQSSTAETNASILSVTFQVRTNSKEAGDETSLRSFESERPTMSDAPCE